MVPFATLAIVRHGVCLLAPTLGVLCYLYLLPFITSGPGMDIYFPYFIRMCDERWWVLPLFLNNYLVEKMCLPHMW